MIKVNDIEARREQILKQIADLARLLGMIPCDDTISIIEPVSQDSMSLAIWLDDTRNSFLKLSISVSEALDIQL
ncbi:hypothetical protein OAC89_01240 [Deltaproteobacteria bacterium]|nr:hypothetical protein [Deltaproteobacteria bacterium]